MAEGDPKEHDKKKEEEVQEQEESDQVVNPWVVSAKEGEKIDYDKLIVKFGCQKLDESLVQRIERLTNRPAHVFLRRGVFFAHRFSSEIQVESSVRQGVFKPFPSGIRGCTILLFILGL